MKKVILLLVLLFSLCGCVNINDSTIEDIIADIKDSDLKLSNQYRKGYKFYLPTNISVKSYETANEVLTDGQYNYYLYVDMISYYNETKYEYKVKDNCYKSINLKDNKAFGYLEINEKNPKYLIEIMYNYAKIEVMVDKSDINEAVTNSLVMLSTISFNKDIIENMLGSELLNFSEEEFNIFDTNQEESNFLEIEKEFGTYDGEELPDYDLIN